MDNARYRIGKVGRAHGVRGELRIFPLDEESDSLGELKCLSLVGMWGRRDFEVERSKRHERFYVVKLRGINDRESASVFCGGFCEIERSWLCDLGEGYYCCDLIGCELVDENGRECGEVVDIRSNGVQDVFVYRRLDGHEGMFPNVPYYVLGIFLEDRKIRVVGEAFDAIDEVYG